MKIKVNYIRTYTTIDVRREDLGSAIKKYDQAIKDWASIALRIIRSAQ